MPECAERREKWVDAEGNTVVVPACGPDRKPGDPEPKPETTTPQRDGPAVEPPPVGAATEISPTCIADPVMGCTVAEQLLITWLDRNVSRGNKFVTEEMERTYRIIKQNQGQPVDDGTDSDSGTAAEPAPSTSEMPSLSDVTSAMEKNPASAALGSLVLLVIAAGVLYFIFRPRRGGYNPDGGDIILKRGPKW